MPTSLILELREDGRHLGARGRGAPEMDTEGQGGQGLKWCWVVDILPAVLGRDTCGPRRLSEPGRARPAEPAGHDAFGHHLLKWHHRTVDDDDLGNVGQVGAARDQGEHQLLPLERVEAELDEGRVGEIARMHRRFGDSKALRELEAPLGEVEHEVAVGIVNPRRVHQRLPELLLQGLTGETELSGELLDRTTDIHPNTIACL